MCSKSFSIQDIEESLGEILTLKEKLKDVKSENIKHSQVSGLLETRIFIPGGNKYPFSPQLVGNYLINTINFSL